MTSRLARDRQGRLIAIDADGHRWIVLGNQVFSTASGTIILFGWLGKSGRPPTARERAEARVPYNAPAPMLERPTREVPDDQLDDEAAIAAAYREQRREPADLVNVAA